MKSWHWLALLAVAVLGLYGAYLYKYPTYTFAYRLTVEVDVDGKAVSGSSVRRVWRGHQLLAVSAPYWNETDAEAVVVDLGVRGTLFVTLYEPNDFYANGVMMPERVLRRAGLLLEDSALIDAGKDPRMEQWRHMSQLQDCVDLNPDEYPFFVRFRALTEPGSVERVDPNNLAASFGSGVVLKTLTLCMVDEPPSRKVEQVLPWLDAVEPGYLIPPLRKSLGANASFAQRLTTSAFLRRRR